jgi:hypothetical protein
MESETLFGVALVVVAFLAAFPLTVMNRGANRWWRIVALSGLVIFLVMIVVALLRGLL